MNQSIEEIEAIVDRKLAQRDAERDEKRDAERDATRDAVRDAEIEVECENVEREASNEGGLQKRRKQSSCESTTVVHGDKEKLKDIKEPKSCFLFSPYTEDTMPIARGMVYPIGDGTIHGGPLIPYYMKENTLTSKDKASQSKAATLQPTLVTPIPVNTKLSGII
nr:hypothetical protein [Tanacetum cinerariifolium]